MRAIAVVLTIVLLGATPPPDPPAGPAGDHLTALLGAWTCRDGANVTSKLTVRSERDAIVVDERRDDAGSASTLTQRFRHDPASGAWHVEERGTPHGAYAGTAPSWSSDTWTIAGVQTWSYNGLSSHDPRSLRYVRVDDGTFYRGAPEPDSPIGVRGEVCARGDAPPAPALCPARDVPAVSVQAAQPNFRSSAGPPGIVHVLVSLDVESHVVAAKIQSSSEPQLNARSLDAARRSTYRTAFHDCRAVPSEYLFTVDYR